MGKELSYSFRLRMYEKKKRDLQSQGLSTKEYETELKKLAEKYRV